jgi:hypothetical protein
MSPRDCDRRKHALPARAMWLGMSLCGVLLACASISMGPLGFGISQAATASARAARTFSMNENGRLKLIGKHGFTLNERGVASGTITGTIYVHLTIVSTDRVSAEVNIYPRGGSITGKGTASYVRGSATAGFNGTISIAGGTGSYANAHGSGLSFSGTIARSNDAITVHVAGRVSD